MGYIPNGLFDNPQGNIIDFILTYASRFQFISHASIAVNRFLVLTEAWTERKQRVTFVTSLMLPIPAAALKLIGRISLVELTTPGTYALVRDPMWVNAGVPVTVAVYSTATAIVSIVYELRSLIVYKRLTSSAKLKYRNDFLLLGKSKGDRETCLGNYVNLGVSLPVEARFDPRAFKEAQ
ncbi:hypothetical protein AAVH_31717 [Aphelenchoides avenae]|nr:hypothetical protein AAVH_31717 [Aphelenchus avenae]